ncbi:MAG TPA: hypothetical protein PK950_01085 [Candidatus Paceibacterota bacterium]|nr:hypothetical protein [Candidatus Paceibacterota bacterium]
MISKTKKPVLFLDFDGLQFDTIDSHKDYINEKYGIATIRSDYIDNNHGLHAIIKKYLPVDMHDSIIPEQVYADIGENLNASIERNMNLIPIEGMREIVPMLAEKYELWTVTARQKSSLEVIEYLQTKHVPNCVIGIHCVWDHLGDYKFHGHSKRDFIANFQGEKVAFIDDSLSEILDMQDIVPSYLFDPRRIHINHPKVQHRVISWEEIGRAFL